MTSSHSAVSPSAGMSAAATSASDSAIVLLGHGSRAPGWNAPLLAMQTDIAAQDPAVRVTCAYLDYLPPQLPDALSALVAEHAPTHILIVPVFLGAGGHVTEDVPRLVDAARQAHPHIHFHLSQNIGDRPELSALVAQLTLGDLQHCTAAAASR